MATKKTTEKSKAAKSKKAPAKKPAAKKTAKAKTAAEPVAAAPRHPRAKLAALHGDKKSLAKSLAAAIAREDEDEGVIEERLRTASNTQLLRLQHAVDEVKAKFGDRGKLIAAIGKAENKSKDKDFLAKLDTFSLPRLLDLVRAGERRARA